VTYCEARRTGDGRRDQGFESVLAGGIESVPARLGLADLLTRGTHLEIAHEWILAGREKGLERCDGSKEREGRAAAASLDAGRILDEEKPPNCRSRRR